MLPDLSNLFAITKLNAKATKIKNKMSSITSLVITDVVNTKFTDAENNIPDFSGLVRKIKNKVVSSKTKKVNKANYRVTYLLMQD